MVTTHQAIVSLLNMISTKKDLPDSPATASSINGIVTITLDWPDTNIISRDTAI